MRGIGINPIARSVLFAKLIDDIENGFEVDCGGGRMSIEKVGRKALGYIVYFDCVKCTNNKMDMDNLCACLNCKYEIKGKKLYCLGYETEGDSGVEE